MKIRFAQPAKRNYLLFWAMLIALVLSHQFSTPSYAREVTLEWDHSISKNVTVYWVYYKKCFKRGPPYDGTEANQGKSPIKMKKKDNTFTLTGLSDSVNYCFAVKSYDSAGRRTSSYSNEVCTDCEACPDCPESNKHSETQKQLILKKDRKLASATALTTRVITKPEKTAEKQPIPKKDRKPASAKALSSKVITKPEKNAEKQPIPKEDRKPASAKALSSKFITKPEKTAGKQLAPEELAVAAPVTSPSGEVIELSRGQVEIIKKQTGVFYGEEAADMLGPGEVVVALPDELGGGYLYGKPEHLAQAFAAAGATEGSVPATHLFVKRRSCLGF